MWGQDDHLLSSVEEAQGGRPGAGDPTPPYPAQIKSNYKRLDKVLEERYPLSAKDL